VARNFWFDAFAADKAEKVSFTPITKAERIANLRRGIEMYQRCADRADNHHERERCLNSVAVRQANLANLIGAAA
jgi:hypothetical protein